MCPGKTDIWTVALNSLEQIGSKKPILYHDYAINACYTHRLLLKSFFNVFNHICVR